MTIVIPAIRTKKNATRMGGALSIYAVGSEGDELDTDHVYGDADGVDHLAHP